LSQPYQHRHPHPHPCHTRWPRQAVDLNVRRTDPSSSIRCPKRENAKPGWGGWMMGWLGWVGLDGWLGVVSVAGDGICVDALCSASAFALISFERFHYAATCGRRTWRMDFVRTNSPSVRGGRARGSTGYAMSMSMSLLRSDSIFRHFANELFS